MIEFGSRSRDSRNMSLVTYSSSSSDDEPPQTSLAKKPRVSSSTTPSASSTASNGSLPPPPDFFANLYATPVRSSVSDDPTLHGGRQRSSPHVPGLWPSHAYVEWTPSSSTAALLGRLIEKASFPPTHGTDGENRGQVQSLLLSALGAPAPLHISLSTTLQLKTDQREDFLARSQAAVQGAGIGPFEVEPEGVKWVGNGIGTRAFLVLNVGEKHARSPRLGQLLWECNSVAEHFGFDPLYARSQHKGEKRKKNGGARSADAADLAARCHVSIAWRLPHAIREENGAQKEGEQSLSLDENLLQELKGIRIPVEKVKVKIGNSIADILLGSSWDSQVGGKGWLGF
jgi:U6 snRNA phosphodiesterase